MSTPNAGVFVCRRRRTLPRLLPLLLLFVSLLLNPRPASPTRQRSHRHPPRGARRAHGRGGGGAQSNGGRGNKVNGEDAPRVQVHADGSTEAWTPRVSLELFNQRKKNGPPLTRRDRHHEIALQRQVLQQFYDDERETRRLTAEADKPRKPHPLLCNSESCIVAGLKVHFEDQKGLFFCRDCPHPALEGSWIDVWECHHNTRAYGVGAALVYAVPNDGRAEIMNHEDVRGRIALVKRGVVSLNDKVRHAQEAGAQGVVILNSPCNRQRDGLRCEVEAKERAYGHGFGLTDPRAKWEGIHIPAVMVSEDDGERLLSMMDLESMDMGPELGEQFYDRVLNS